MICDPEPYSREAHIGKFNRYLVRAVEEGRHVGGCTTWMDEETTAAIGRVARAFPNPDRALVEAAREEFAKQLDGTHAAKMQAEFEELADIYFAPWPQTAFADSVKAAFNHVLDVIACPARYAEADRARRELAAAQSYSADDPSRDLIVEQLCVIVEELDLIPDYSIEMDGGPQDVQRFSADIETALRHLMNFAENGKEQHLDHFRDRLDSALECRPPSTNAARDWEIVMANFRFIGACLDPRPDER